MNSQIQFIDVNKSFDGKTTVIDNLNFKIHEGEFLTLLGPSGSGKTTTLMLLAGFEPLSSGKILYNNSDISHFPSYKRNFGFVFQNYALFPHLSVFDNIAFPLRMRKIARSRIDTAITEALDMVKLGYCRDRFPSELSGGQQQRIALARALVFNPSVVLMDEPLGALDKNLREEMQLELKEIHTNLGITFVFVTHDQDEALTMSDRVAVFNDGQIIQTDTPEVIYNSPANAFVAKFVGESNQIPSSLVTDSDGTKVKVANKIFEGVVRCTDRLTSGQQCIVFIRPEYVSISSMPSTPNALEAVLVDVVFRGSYVIKKVETSRGVILFSKSLISSPRNSIGAEIQKKVFVTIDYENAVAFAN